MFNGLAGRPRDHSDLDLSRPSRSGAPSLLPGGHPTRLADLGFLDASVRLSPHPRGLGSLTNAGANCGLNLSPVSRDPRNARAPSPLGLTASVSMTCPVSVRYHPEGYPVRGAVGQLGASPRHRGSYPSPRLAALWGRPHMPDDPLQVTPAVAGPFVSAIPAHPVPR